MKMSIYKALWLSVCTFVLSLQVARAEIYVISHPDMDVPDASVRDVFLGEQSFVGSVKLVLFDNAAAQTEFLTLVLQMDADKYSSVWTKKGFRDGVNAPTSKNTDFEVISAVRRTPGAIGYVTSLPNLPSALNIRVVARYH